MQEGELAGRQSVRAVLDNRRVESDARLVGGHSVRVKEDVAAGILRDGVDVESRGRIDAEAEVQVPAEHELERGVDLQAQARDAHVEPERECLVDYVLAQVEVELGMSSVGDEGNVVLGERRIAIKA